MEYDVWQCFVNGRYSRNRKRKQAMEIKIQQAQLIELVRPALSTFKVVALAGMIRFLQPNCNPPNNPNGQQFALCDQQKR